MVFLLRPSSDPSSFRHPLGSIPEVYYTVTFTLWTCVFVSHTLNLRVCRELSVCRCVLLTLQLGRAQAALQPLHLALQEADVPHHVLRWVDLHGNVPRGGRGRHWLVQLLLQDSDKQSGGWYPTQHTHHIQYPRFITPDTLTCSLHSALNISNWPIVA